MKSKKVVFATTTRNPGNKFIRTIKKIHKIAKKFKDSEIIIVESDSNKPLKNLFSKIKKYQVQIIRLGNLQFSIPFGNLRTERIAFSRNKYLENIFKSNRLKKFDYLIVFDSDGVCKKINYTKIHSALNIEQSWDAQFANQSFFYYDLYALRKKNWVNYDCLDKVNRDISKNKNPKRAIVKFISNNVKRIKSNHELIKVNSAFGGLGIYKINKIGSSLYCGVKDSKSICEHISFNRGLLGKNLYINPSLINSSGINEHTIKSKFLTFFPDFIFNKIYKIKKLV